MIEGSRGYQAACQVAFRLKKSSFRGVIVGGAVRDMLLGKFPDDLDMVTTASPEEFAEIFPEAKLVGASFGVFLLKQNGIALEIASARSERAYMDGRHPENVTFTGDLSLDALRRDFTVNAMMYDPLTGELLDFVGGKQDLCRGLLRSVGDAGMRFREDFLRILRAVRFAAKLDFEIDGELLAAMKQFAHLAAGIAPERIKAELDNILCGKNPDRAFRIMASCGVLKHILPEIDALRGVEQPPQYHPEGDVFEHTMLMLQHMRYPDPLLGWSVLMHDIGKAVTFSRDPDSRIRFFTHEERGAEMAEILCRRLRFSKNDTDSCTAAVRNHMRFAFVEKMRKAKLKKLMASPDFSMELELHRLDCISSHHLMDCFVFLLDQLKLCGENITLPPALISGRDLIAEVGLKPGPEFKSVLENFYDRQLAGEFQTREAAIAILKKEYEKVKAE